ncbi:MAG: hypothetical protein IIY94_02360 [Oscillospiraceae bacterium]|nr:hypothetical protein [Oscillospiraceae bacterium]
MQIKITWGFLLLLGCFWALDRWGVTLPFLLAAAVHECGHLTALVFLKIPVTGLELRAGGAVIRAALPGGRREALALAAGPSVNLLLAALFWQPWPLFGLCNLSLGLVNLLPFPQRDGGRLLRTLKRNQ